MMLLRIITAILILAPIPLLGQAQEGLLLTGHVENSNQDFVILSHVPLYRGNLNYDGFRSVGSQIDENGDFTIKSNAMIDGGLYYLQVGETGFDLTLHQGDRIHFAFDLTDVDGSLFATGVGAGKINLLRLEELQPIQFDEYRDLDRFRAQLEQNQRTQLELLQAVYLGDVKHPVVSNSLDQAKLVEIMHQTPLSEREYDFLKQQISIRKFSIASFIQVMGSSMGLDSVSDVSVYFSEIFKPENYLVIDDLRYTWMGRALDQILQVEYARHHLVKEGEMGYRDFSMVKRNHDYFKWITQYLQDNFNSAVSDQWIADGISWSMTVGRTYDDRLETFKERNPSKRYLDRLMDFDDLLEHGLANPTYHLNDPDFTLDKLKFEALLESHRGESLYIIFWSAQFAGSSIIDHLPLIKDLRKIYDDEFKVIQICIDAKSRKNLWAARIIDNHWEGRHYFMPIEENEETLVDFGSKRIASFCDGGATFSFVSGDGKVRKQIASPMQLDRYIIRKMMH